LKALLSAVKLPKFKVVKNGDLIFENYFYIYNDKIIKCTKTGHINPEDNFIDNTLMGQSLESV